MGKLQFDVVRSKVFKFHSIRSVLIAKLKIESNQTLEMCKFKLDTESNCNLMQIVMYKTLFLQTNINEVYKSINR